MTGVEAFFREFAAAVALALEAIAVLMIAAGAVVATYRSMRSIGGPLVRKREAWLHLAAWLLIGLEFALGADIVRTAISPGWVEISQLGAIAVIRTLLNFFLGKDLDKFIQAGMLQESPLVVRKAA